MSSLKKKIKPCTLEDNEEFKRREKKIGNLYEIEQVSMDILDTLTLMIENVQLISCSYVLRNVIMMQVVNLNGLILILFVVFEKSCFDEYY